MKKSLLLLSFFVGLFSSVIVAQTKQGTYLYIEVNKNLPVSVKLNEKNVRNDNKGYIIVPNLKAGTNMLEFNFKNPNFRSHTFQVENKNRSMGLKLTRVSGNRFVLQNVVSKRIINDQTVLNSDPIAIADIEPVTAQKEEQKRGVIKVYEAKDTETPQKTGRPKKRKEEKVIAKTVAVDAKPKTKALHENSEAESTPESRLKAKREEARKRSERLMKLNQASARKKQTSVKTSPTKPAPTKIKDTGEVRKEAKRIEREKRKQALLAKEQEEQKRLEAEREARRLARIEKRKKRQQKADKNDTKTSSREKIINAEPIGNNPDATTKPFTNENEPSAIRCKGTVKSTKVAEWTLKLGKKFDDEARGNYIKRKLGAKCIRTNDLGIVLGNLDTQIGRYKLIRTLYPQIEDPANIDRFNKYFKAKSFVEKLKGLKDNNY